jgi:hypothetical protein
MKSLYQFYQDVLEYGTMPTAPAQPATPVQPVAPAQPAMSPSQIAGMQAQSKALADPNFNKTLQTLSNSNDARIKAAINNLRQVMQTNVPGQPQLQPTAQQPQSTQNPSQQQPQIGQAGQIQK